MIKYWLGILLAIVCVFGCVPDVKYSIYKPVDSDGWNIKDTMEFSTDTLREGGRYKFTCGVRSRRSFPYRDLVMMVERTVYRDTLVVLHELERVTFAIATEEGTPTGEGVALRLHETNLRDFVMERGDSVVAKVYHQMTRETLSGIVDFGFTMEQVNKN